MGVSLQTVELRNATGLPLRVDLRHDADRPVRGKVVVCHGFKGFRRWGFFPWLGEQLAAHGWLSAVLDFSMNGIGEDPVAFDRLDLFERNTYSAELDDLARVLEYVRELPPRDAPVGLLGHSRAAVDVLARAAEDDAVGAVVTWNGVSRALRFTPRQLQEWEREGRMEFTNARTGQRMAIDFGFVRDARERAERLDPVAASARMQAAHLIVHAADDMAVPVAESVELEAGRGDPDRCRRIELPVGGHTFGAVHPFAGPTPSLEAALARTLEWFGQHLTGSGNGV